MSVRRPAPLVAQHQVLSVGALADRLPGSTRLSQVLAAGAKHLTKHKTVDTEAPKRTLIDVDIGFRTSISRPVLAQRVKDMNKMVEAYLAAATAGAPPATLQHIAQVIHGMVFEIAMRALTIADMEVLRRMGAYSVLNWIWQNRPGVGQTAQERAATSQQQADNAELALSQALHQNPNENLDVSDTNNLLAELHDVGVNILGVADGPVATIAQQGERAFEERYQAEQRQKVEDDREAKRQRRKQDMRDGKISEELEKDVEKKENAEGLQDGQIVPGTTERDAERKKAESKAAESDPSGGAVGGSGDYDDIRDATDDEEDENEGNPEAQQVNRSQKK